MMRWAFAFCDSHPQQLSDKYLVRCIRAARGEVSSRGLLVGGLTGGLSHPLLDGIMHPDVRPFMPWSDHNPFLGLVGVAQLHLACIAAALFGAVCLTLWRVCPAGQRKP
jgi:membrane-bound metal-dependent hydrolase YbcI (DUF457 family)